MSECRVSQKELIEQITDRIGLLTNSIPPWAKQKLSKIADQWFVSVSEIEDLGDVTQMTCEAMSRLMITSEEDSKRKLEKGYDRQTFNWHLGLRLLHNDMAWLLPEGANEGNKGCCPFCTEDC